MGIQRLLSLLNLRVVLRRITTLYNSALMFEVKRTVLIKYVLNLRLSKGGLQGGPR